jgi:hypothetical protein
VAINLAAAAVAEMTERQTKFRRRDVNDAENQTRAISHPFNIDTALPVIAAAPQVRHVYSSVRPNKKISSSVGAAHRGTVLHVALTGLRPGMDSKL